MGVCISWRICSGWLGRGDYFVLGGSIEVFVRLCVEEKEREIKNASAKGKTEGCLVPFRLFSLQKSESVGHFSQPTEQSEKRKSAHENSTETQKTRPRRESRKE